MANLHSAEKPPRLTGIQWLICIIAAIGFAFDTYELLMLPLIVRPALEQLGGLTFGSPQYAYWRDLMFYVPAICGGIFGLLGGYLTDRLGRRRILTWSILLYAFSAFAAVPLCMDGHAIRLGRGLPPRLPCERQPFHSGGCT